MSAVILSYKGVSPVIASDVFVAPTASIIGDTHIGSGSTVWFGAVLRGDVHHIRIGKNTNIQDGAVGHVTTGKWPLMVGDRVTVGHRAVIHGCTLMDECLVGMGAVVLDGATIETGAMVAAGAVVSPGKTVPTGWIYSGVPARPLREMTEAEKAYLAWSAAHYAQLGQAFLKNA